MYKRYAYANFNTPYGDRRRRREAEHLDQSIDLPAAIGARGCRRARFGGRRGRLP